jgi:hypothetical protein
MKPCCCRCGSHRYVVAHGTRHYCRKCWEQIRILLTCRKQPKGNVKDQMAAELEQMEGK